MAKLTRQHVIIIGSVLTVLVAAGIFFFLIRPLMEEMTAANQKYESRKSVADQKAAKEKDRVAALNEVRNIQNQWNLYERQKMPDINISNLLRAMEQRWKEQSVVLGPKVNRYLRADRTVRVTTPSIAVPAPPSDPNAVNARLIELDLGAVTVQGAFPNVLKHAERWNRFDRLVRVDNLALSGVSPNLTGQYGLKVYIFTRGEPGVAIPAAGAAGAGGAGGMSSYGSGSGGGSGPPM